jgi:hypothetical protein
MVGNRKHKTSICFDFSTCRASLLGEKTIIAKTLISFFITTKKKKGDVFFWFIGQ